MSERVEVHRPERGLGDGGFPGEGGRIAQCAAGRAVRSRNSDVRG